MIRKIILLIDLWEVNREIKKIRKQLRNNNKNWKLSVYNHMGWRLTDKILRKKLKYMQEVADNIRKDLK